MNSDGRNIGDFSSHTVAFAAGVILLFICLVTSFAGYALYPAQPEKNPPRIAMASNGGEVLFPHHQHFDENGAAFDCADCHHNEDADTATLAGMDCRSCHYGNPDVVETVCADDANHPRCVGRKCMECHDGEECGFCHRK